MSKQILIIQLIGISVIFGCINPPKDKLLLDQIQPQEMKVTEETLKHVLDAFNRHDLDAIMDFFSENCSFDFPRGPEPWGQRFTGKHRCGRPLRVASKESRMCTMAKTVIGFPPKETGDYPNGH